MHTLTDAEPEAALGLRPSVLRAAASLRRPLAARGTDKHGPHQPRGNRERNIGFEMHPDDAERLKTHAERSLSNGLALRTRRTWTS
jgi:hypothetical protein